MTQATHFAVIDSDIDDLKSDIQEIHTQMKEIQEDLKTVRNVMIGLLSAVTASAVLFAINIAVHAFS